MGYVHNTHMSQFIPPTVMHGTVAAWAMAAGQVSGAWVFACDATDEAAVCLIPIQIPSNSVASQGAKLTSIEIDYEILTAACDAVTAVIKKITRGADGAVCVVDAAVPFSYDTGHDTAAERYDVDQHKMTLTLTTPVYIDNDEYYYVEITFDKAATSTVEILGAFANYTLRV